MSPIDNPGIGEVILRLVAATAVGCAIGLNRELKGKPAGLRTHALVTLGTVLFTLSSIHLSLSQGVAGTDALSIRFQNQEFTEAALRCNHQHYRGHRTPTAKR